MLRFFRRSAAEPVVATGGAAELFRALTARIGTPQRATSVLARVEAFERLPPERQARELPALYLLCEQYLVEMDSNAVDRNALRTQVRQQYAPLLESPGFAIVFQPAPVQEIFLCRFMLERILHRAGDTLGTAQGHSLGALLSWLDTLPESATAPVPLLGEPVLPGEPGEWVQLLCRVSDGLYQHLCDALGAHGAARLFSAGYDAVLEMYSNLESFPVVVGMLPDALVDEEKITLLSQRQVRRVVLDRVDRLQRVNEQLMHQNEELTLMEEMLRAARDELELRVAERTAELQSANESLLREINDRKALEVQLAQSQKMEAVGRLAGGVAHDFNNLLTAIKGHLEFLLEDLPAGSESRADAEGIGDAADRAASLTRQLLAFSRRQVLQPRVIDLNQTVQEMEKMLRRVIGEDVDLSTRIEPALGHVQADPGQLSQVLLNLAVNARDAMPRGGQLTIETANVELDDEYARGKVHVESGRYVMLAVSDTGVGMDAETQARIFEPFFTTKEQGKGTGLGLSTVYGIVEQSGGHVWVYSEPGHGTAFKVYLPRVDAPVSLDTALIGAPATGRETVLLAEDDRAVRVLARRALEHAGYQVLEADGGEEALRIADAHAGTIHLLLSDVVMPGLGGRELAERLQGRRPGIAVLFMSGYTDDAILRHGMLAEGTPFLEKPFTPGGLCEKVRGVLDRDHELRMENVEC
ncbi:MAG TPA: ATP-binding protein [Longimicrobiaceae bacterium]|nr:ATP-binding protein [Longimicrobiaceae bacterium]